MKAMIFAAGMGTRLKPFTDHHPKALAEVNGVTLLELTLRYLQRFGIYDIVINVHHFAEQIENTLYENSDFGSNIAISDERDPLLDTGGGLKKAAWFFEHERNFVAMNVDILTNLDLEKMMEAQEASDGVGTLAVMKRQSSRQLLFDEHMDLCGWTNNGTNEQKISREVTWMQPFAFSGIQVLSTEVFKDCPFEGKFSLIDWYLHLAQNHVLKGYDHSGNIFIDVGKPESLEKAGYLF